MKSLLLLHDLHFIPADYISLQERLDTPDTRIFTPESPLIGRIAFINDPPLTYYEHTVPKYISDYMAIRSIHQPILIGHGIGAIAATYLYTSCPQTFDSRLVLLSPWLDAQPLTALTSIFTLKHAPRNYQKIAALYQALLRENFGARTWLNGDLSRHHSSPRPEILLITGRKDRSVPFRKIVNYAFELRENFNVYLAFFNASDHDIFSRKARIIGEIVYDFAENELVPDIILDSKPEFYAIFGKKAEDSAFHVAKIISRTIAQHPVPSIEKVPLEPNLEPAVVGLKSTLSTSE